MDNPANTLAQPPWTHNPQHAPRRVGVELEMNGLDVDTLSGLVAGFLGAEISEKGRYERRLRGDAAGDWVVELDFDLLKRMGRKTHERDSLSGELGSTAEDALAWVAEAVVPVELVSPPLPLDRLDDVERLIDVLQRAGARGTSDRLINAFGMQFNPEIPSTDPHILTACLKAFLCLYDWLHARADIDVARRVTRYVDPFPLAYVRHVVADGYWPDTATLIDDYLEHNPTRNRALDLLPLFAHLDEARVRRVTDDPLIKARPAFHYRLPDCDIHVPGWGLAQAWNDWVEVERLAADSTRLAGCCAAYLALLDHPLERWLADWRREVETRWLA